MSEQFPDLSHLMPPLSQEEAGDLPLAIPVDLLREEFVRFNMIVSRYSGKMRLSAGYLAFTGLAAVVSLGLLITQILSYGTFDLMIALLFLLVVVSGIVSIFGTPAYIKNAAGRSYDETMMEGQSYYGRVFVFPDRIEKHSEQRSAGGGLQNTVLRYDSDIRYIETEDMMIFLNPGRPAIVLPARCLSGQHADAVRRIALPVIPAWQQKLGGRLKPALTEPVTEPLLPSEDDDLPAVRVHVAYTQAELRALAAEDVLKAFSSRLPLYSVGAILAALLAIVLFGSMAGGAVAFLLIIAALLGIPMLRRQQAASVRFEEQEENGGFSIRITRAGLTIRSPDRPAPRHIAWRLVTRAAEGAGAVDFYLPGGRLNIPKRCMNDTVLREIRSLADENVRKG